MFLEVGVVGRDGGRGAGAGVAIEGCWVGGVDFGAVGYQAVVVFFGYPFVDYGAGPGV